jgi:hypothetical protein
LKAGRNTHKVLCDGDTSQMKSSGAHLQAHAALDDVGGTSSDDDDDENVNSDQEEEGDMEDDDGMTAGPSGGGMSTADIEAEEATAHLAPGGGRVAEDHSEAGDPAPQDPSYEGGNVTVECHGWEWKKAINVPDQRERKGRPTGKFRNLPITFEMTELEIFEELMPLSWMELLGRLRSNAATNRDRNVYTLND